MTFDNYGTIASIAGLILSAWTLILVSGFRKYIERRIRLPDLLANLNQSIERLPRNEAPDIESAREVFAIIEGNLHVIHGKVDGPTKRRVAEAQDLVKSVIRAVNQGNMDSCLEARYSLRALQDVLNSYNDDLKVQTP